MIADRAEVTKEEDFSIGDDDEEEEEDDWEGNVDWGDEAAEEAEEDVRDASAAYLEFLNEEVRKYPLVILGSADADFGA